MRRARFYRDVLVERADEGYRILLDGKPIRTPARAAFLLPSEALAQAVAEEWRAQGEKFDPESLHLTKLANTAIDRVAVHRDAFIEQFLAFAKSDLICYRATAPQDLVARQTAQWDSLLEWAQERYGAQLRTGAGIGFVEQPREAIEGLARALAGRDDFVLAALNAAAAITGSAIIAFGLSEGRLDADEGFAASQLDEIYQAERWGEDSEALIQSRSKAAELTNITRLFQFCAK
ncbi:MAG TPA: ATP12 family protein [Micropepsaceae bacterium]|nr:ATP12 family protein [Micropepsaceae bacterium]